MNAEDRDRFITELTDGLQSATDLAYSVISILSGLGSIPSGQDPIIVGGQLLDTIRQSMEDVDDYKAQFPKEVYLRSASGTDRVVRGYHRPVNGESRGSSSAGHEFGPGNERSGSSGLHDLTDSGDAEGEFDGC